MQSVGFEQRVEKMVEEVPFPAEHYNGIADSYRDAKRSNRRVGLVNATMGDLIGDPTGLDAVDLATGEGTYARFLKRKGSKSVLGIDISREMIRLARSQEEVDLLGIDYIEADLTSFETERTFDLATAGFLLNYAASRDQLRSLCASTRRLLKPGARFVGVNINMFVETYGYNDWVSVGRRMSGPADPQEGDTLTIYLTTDAGREVVFDNYYLNPKTYEQVFAEVGFSSFRWVPLKTNPEAHIQLGEELLEHLVRHSQVIGFEARI